jgi:hypothetical protein
MEEAAELGNYLPISFKTIGEQDYIAFLWDAFDTNYTHGKYQFALLAYHMLTMSFVYFNIWQIRQARPDDFEKGLIGFGKDIEKSMLGATSPFVFSSVNERSILRLLKLISCDDAKIGTYARLVDDRNKTAHSNGNIFCSTQAEMDAIIAETLRVVDEIQTYSKPVIEDAYRDFLIQSHDPDEREYPDAPDQIREILVRENYLSLEDIGICLGFDLADISDRPEIDNIRTLHEVLRSAYGPDNEQRG